MNNNYNSPNGRRPQGQQNMNPRNQHGQQNRQSVPYPPVKHRSRRQRNGAVKTLVISVLTLVILIVAVSLIVFNVGSRENDVPNAPTTDALGSPIDTGNGTDSGVGGDEPTVVPGVDVTPEVPEVDVTPKISDDDTEIEVAAEEVHRGYQILINYEYAYDFENGFVQDNVFNKKGRSFYPFDTNTHVEHVTLNAFCDLTEDFKAESGNSDIIITSGWRDLESQQSAYDYYVELYSEEYATMFAAQPGHSEHHTGLAMDLSIYGDGRTFETEKQYAEWFAKNAHKYGFILRYPEDKSEITKISYEYWHYRYIGVPHAYYMKAKNICLEEYIELLRGYGYFSPLTFTDDEGNSWKIYYTAAEEGETTTVAVPKNGLYEISGNNVDGFIVTVQVMS